MSSFKIQRSKKGRFGTLHLVLGPRLITNFTIHENLQIGSALYFWFYDSYFLYCRFVSHKPGAGGSDVIIHNPCTVHLNSWTWRHTIQRSLLDNGRCRFAPFVHGVWKRWRLGENVKRFRVVSMWKKAWAFVPCRHCSQAHFFKVR